MSRTTYIFRDGKLINKADYIPPPVERSHLPSPMIIGDIEPYESPIDGRPIGSRNQRRDDLRAHGCVEWEPGIRQSARLGRDRSRRAKAGIPDVESVGWKDK